MENPQGTNKDFLSVQKKETDRVEAFSDGVFAIAITLLVLDLKVPAPTAVSAAGGLGAALVQRWPSYLAFFISFVNILIMWVNHHNVFSHIRRTDGFFLFLNGFLLMTVTAVPFPTALLSEYIKSSHAGLAAGIFAGSILMNCLSFNFLWAYTSKNNRLLEENTNPAVVSKVRFNGLLGLPFYLLAVILAFYSVTVSIGICFALTVFFAVTASVHHLLPGA
jgi:uncharacterized membrane protein